MVSYQRHWWSFLTLKEVILRLANYGRFFFLSKIGMFLILYAPLTPSNLTNSFVLKTDCITILCIYEINFHWQTKHNYHDFFKLFHGAVNLMHCSFQCFAKFPVKCAWGQHAAWDSTVSSIAEWIDRISVYNSRATAVKQSIGSSQVGCSD